MKKMVAVDRRLGNLIMELKAKGYEVTDLYETGKQVDACIYYDGIRDFHNTGWGAASGVLMINGRGMAVEEVLFVLERGTYSSLF
ncbi:MAG: hypothetical protein HPY66_2619 [Firmicutes bacterium]|nr:hypothetical protein [Bacillota bacterium]MDI6704993.1 YkuS family protein [Bacillota bacterium]